MCRVAHHHGGMDSPPQPHAQRPPTDAPGSVPYDPLVSDLLPAFLEHLRVEEGRASGTLARYASHLHRLVQAIGDRPVQQLHAEQLAVYKRHLMDAGLAPATRATMLSGLRSFLRYARHVRGLEVYDPEKVRRPTIPRQEVAYLTKAEVGRLLAVIPIHTFVGLRDRALVEVLCATGMRIAEALALTREQIDWEEAQARIVGKGHKPRKVYFTAPALQWVAQYLAARHDALPVLFVTTGDPPKAMQANGTWKRLRRYAHLAGISKRVYPHMLRHTMATTLLANGCPIGHIRVLLGHTHLSTTCKYYLGTMSDSEAKAAHAQYLSYREPTGTETPGTMHGHEHATRKNLDVDLGEI